MKTSSPQLLALLILGMLWVVCTALWIYYVFFCSGHLGGDTEDGDCDSLFLSLPKMSGTADELFSFHALGMSLSFITVFFAGSLSFRFVPGSHATKKLVHMVLNTIAVLFAWLAFAAIYKTHGGDSKPPQFYTPHSFLGMLVLVVMSIQWLAGFLCYNPFFQVASDDLKAALLPYHRCFGVATLLLGLAQYCVGIMDKAAILYFVKGIPKFSDVSVTSSWIVTLVSLLGMSLGVVLMQKYEKRDNSQFRPLIG